METWNISAVWVVTSSKEIDGEFKSAVYSALKGDDENKTQAVDVFHALQAAIGKYNGVVKINNSSLDGDPSKGNGKHFAAIAALDNVDHHFACKEDQIIGFFHTVAPTGS